MASHSSASSTLSYKPSSSLGLTANSSSSSTTTTTSSTTTTSTAAETSTVSANRNQHFTIGTYANHSTLPKSFTPPPPAAMANNININKSADFSSQPLFTHTNMMPAINGAGSANVNPASQPTGSGDASDKKVHLFGEYRRHSIVDNDHPNDNNSDTKLQGSNGKDAREHTNDNNDTTNPPVSSTTNNVKTVYDSNGSNETNVTNGTSTTIVKQSFVKTKFRPKRKPPVVVEKPETPKSQEKQQKHHGLWQLGRFDTRGSPLVPLFEWDTYLKISPAKVAPREAFRQPEIYPQNKFVLGMKLEARDPRNSNNWCLASVVGIEGLHIRLRFDGADKMNDLYELVDSENIRSVGSSPGDLLLPPTGFIHSLANYSKFVEKVLKSDDAIIASPDCFPKTPSLPKKNLFEVGMKLEAVDRKNRDLICPATIGEVTSDKKKVKIMFDGWRGSFDYMCEYTSRDLFPINWCRDVGRPIQPPNGWETLLNQGANQTPSPSSSQSTPSATKHPATLSKSESKTSPKNVSQTSSQSSTSKKRGRPKKNSSPPSHSNTQFKSSTPKNDKSRQHKSSTDKLDETEGEQTPIESPNEISSEHTFEIPSFQDHQEPKNRYQCQRTISYTEWRETKLQAQMPQEAITTIESPIGSNLNESASMVSTISYQQDLPETSEQPSSNGMPSPKRLKSCHPRSDVLQRKPKELSRWTVEDVIELIATEESLLKYKEIFMEQEIDGKAFELLTTEELRMMGVKMGPVLKIKDLREQVKREMAL